MQIATEKDLYVDMMFKSVPQLCIISKSSRAPELAAVFTSCSINQDILYFLALLMDTTPPPNTHVLAHTENDCNRQNVNCRHGQPELA